MDIFLLFDMDTGLDLGLDTAFFIDGFFLKGTLIFPPFNCVEILLPFLRDLFNPDDIRERIVLAPLFRQHLCP